MIATGFAVIVGSDRTVHVVPVGDSFAHDLSEECLCGPSVEIVPESDGTCGRLIAHPSLDGREIDNG